MNFKAVLALPKTACSAQTDKSISFIWIVWSTLYVYLCLNDEKLTAVFPFILAHFDRASFFWTTCGLNFCILFTCIGKKLVKFCKEMTKILVQSLNIFGFFHLYSVWSTFCYYNASCNSVKVIFVFRTFFYLFQKSRNAWIWQDTLSQKDSSLNIK